MFKVGDRVRVTNNGSPSLYALKGTVVSIYKDIISVEFDRHIKGHSCMGLTKEGYGWNLHREHLTRIPNNSTETEE